MNIKLLNSRFQVIAVVDQYTSLMWCKRYYDNGALDLEIEANAENIDLFKKNFYIIRDDDDTIYRIEGIELETDENGDDKLIIGGVDCKAILSQRITWGQVFVRNTTVENFINEMIKANITQPTNSRRKISNFRTDIPVLTTDRTTRQSTYEDIGEKVIELCKENRLGSRVYLDGDGNFVFTMYRGKDLSLSQDVNPRIVFSHDFENLFSSKYTFDSSEYKNAALIGGEGEGADRKLRDIGDTSGLERREMFVDASRANSDGGDLVDYYAALIAEGKEALAETANVASFEGEVDAGSYEYKRDYNLGDIVTVINKYGMMVDARIVEIIETWDNEGYTIEPVFEYVAEEGELVEAILTEDSEPMMTENREIMKVDHSPLITDDGQFEILGEDGKPIIVEQTTEDLYD